MHHAILMSGLAGSGKTTWARHCGITEHEYTDKRSLNRLLKTIKTQRINSLIAIDASGKDPVNLASILNENGFSHSLISFPNRQNSDLTDADQDQ